MSGHEFDPIVAWIRRISRPLLISHERPDGDAYGSLSAMNSMLAEQGKYPTALLFEIIPSRYSLFCLHADWKVQPGGMTTPPVSADAVIILDTSSYSQLTPLAAWLRETKLPKLVIDHHETSDGIGEIELRQPLAPATCLLLHQLFRHAGWAVTPVAAEALFVGIATDTGWFRHSNTNSEALASCAELARRGANCHEIYQSLYLQDTEARVRLLGEALQTLRLYAQGRVAILTLNQEAFTRAGACPADTEEIVNEPLRIGTVIVSVLLVEQTDGQIRVNLRSKQPAERGGQADIDVASVAASLGGGGHRRAAGARISGTLDLVERQVLERVLKAL